MNSQPVRVAFCGPAGAGKTEHARLCQKQTGGDVLSFASPLKKLVSDLLGERDPHTMRSALQEFGVLARKYDSEVWVNKLLAKVSRDRPCFVDDCRFTNEANALRALGFTLVRVDASIDELLKRRPGMTYSQRLHESEVEGAMIRADLIVMTDQPIEDAQAEIAALLQLPKKK